MSAENLELVRAHVETLAERGFEAAREYVHPDFEMSQLPLHPEAATTYRGWDAAVKSMGAWTETFEEFRWEAERFIAAGDRVVVVVRELGRARGGGVDLDHRFGALYTVNEGKISRLQWFDNEAQALKAVRLTGPGTASAANVEIVRRLYERWARGDFAPAEAFDRDVEFARIGRGDAAALAGRWRGIEEATAAVADWLRSWKDVRLEAESFMEIGDRVLVLARQRGFGRVSGARVDHLQADVFALRGGRIACWESYWDPSEAMRAVGLAE